MANQIVKRRSELVTEPIHHGHFSMEDKSVNISGLDVPMDKATYDALKNLILQAANAKADVESISIDEFAVSPK